MDDRAPADEDACGAVRATQDDEILRVLKACVAQMESGAREAQDG